VRLKPRTLLSFYVARVRKHPLQEFLAASGIAVGVALVYAVMVSGGNITSSATQIVDDMAGDATLQITARADRGIDESIADEARKVDGVRDVVPVLRSNVILLGEDGHRAVQLLGATPEVASLDGDLARQFGAGGLRLAAGIAVPKNVAESIGTRSGDDIQLHADGERRRVSVVVPTEDVLGSLAGTDLALTSLPLAQALANRNGKLSQILIQPEPGADGQVQADLERIAGDFANVSAADSELSVLRQAAKPNEQSTYLFAMVGWLFSFNAMLFTVAERRRFIAALRLEGASPRQALTILGFEGLLLGVLASGFGLLLGELLLRTLFGDVPDYLTFAFPVGTERVLQPKIAVLAFAGGMLAVLAASLRPGLDLRSSAPLDAVNQERTEPGEAIPAPTARRLLRVGIGLVALTTAIALAVPAVTIIGGVILAVAALLVMPIAFGFAAARLERMTTSTNRLNMLAVALMELRGTTTMSVALTAVAALAVYGSVAIGGAREDIVRGLDSHTRQWLSNADVWVTTGGQDLMTNSFTAPDLAALRATDGVAAVRVHRGGFLDVGDRRMWLIGRPVRSRTMIPASQMLDGDIEQATARLREGGWATASAALADERDIEIGDRFSLPTPTGERTFRLAATTMNFGWIPGAVTINNREYADVMGTTAPSALEVDLAPGVTAAAGKRAVAAALGPASGLAVQTRAEREAQYFEFGREGVSRLSQIAALLLVAAALAVACALAATLWQRRPRLAALKLQGAKRTQLWRAMLCETAVLVSVGCLVGVAFGIYGHLLAGRFVRTTTGFASPFTVEAEHLLLSGGLVVIVALAVSAIPTWLAAGVPAKASLRE
jgi:putative ABC transport system permease protein